MWVCRRTMGNTWGISPVEAQGSSAAKNTVCISGLLAHGEQGKAKNLLQSLQGSYLRAAVESAKNTLIEAMEVALCLTPLALAVICATRFTAYRLKHQGEWRNTGLGHMKLEFLQKYPFTLKQDRILKKYQAVKQFKVLIPTREDWWMPGKITDPNVDLWCTDESVFMD